LAEGVYWSSFPELPARDGRQPHQSALDRGICHGPLSYFAKCCQTWKVRLRDLLLLFTVILSIPFVIMALGMPIVLAVRLVLWIGSLF
jgi:hypothetical protein